MGRERRRVGGEYRPIRADWLLTRRDMRETYFADPAAARKRPCRTRSSGLRSSGGRLRGTLYREQGRRLEQDLRAAGFSPRVQFLLPPQYATRGVCQQAVPGGLGSAAAHHPASTAFLLSVLHSQGQWNLAAHNDMALDQMIQSAGCGTGYGCARAAIAQHPAACAGPSVSVSVLSRGRRGG